MLRCHQIAEAEATESYALAEKASRNIREQRVFVSPFAKAPEDSWSGGFLAVNGPEVEHEITFSQSIWKLSRSVGEGRDLLDSASCRVIAVV